MVYLWGGGLKSYLQAKTQTIAHTVACDSDVCQRNSLFLKFRRLWEQVGRPSESSPCTAELSVAEAELFGQRLSSVGRSTARAKFRSVVYGFVSSAFLV